MKHQDSHEHIHRYKRLHLTLKASPSSVAMALSSRMAKCAGPKWGYRYTCRTPACPRCRDQYIGRQRRAAQKRFSNASTSEMGLLTVVLGATESLTDVEVMVTKARKDIRNLVDRYRRRCDQWKNVEILVWLETDAIELADFQQLGPDKQKQISEFGTVFAGKAGVLWVPSLHGIIRLGTHLDIDATRHAFATQWPGHKRTDIRPFDQTKILSKNISNIVNYSNKHNCTTEYYDIVNSYSSEREWSVEWMCDYYTWMHSWSRGFLSTKISVRPSKKK